MRIDGEKIRKLREAAGETRKQVEQATGVDRNQICLIETGKTQNPKATTLLALAEHFKLSPMNLMTN